MKVSWQEWCHDSFSDPEDFFLPFEGEFLGIAQYWYGTYGIVLLNGIPRKVRLSRLHFEEPAHG